MPRGSKRTGLLLPVAILVTLTLAVRTLPFHLCLSFVPLGLGARPIAHRSWRCQALTVLRRAEAEQVEVVRSMALAKVEDDIEAKISEAKQQNDNKKVTELARLLVLAKASEATAAWQSTEELRDAVGQGIADTLADFVGKEDYDIQDVAGAVDEKVGKAVSKLDNVYLDEAAAASAPPGSNPVVLSKVMNPVVDSMKEETKEAVAAFTGKEEYEFGDISKEADRRAKNAIATMLGKEEYEFGDLSKAAAGKVMDAVTSFTGKEKYQFGDVTKTVLKKALDFLEGDEEKK